MTDKPDTTERLAADIAKAQSRVEEWAAQHPPSPIQISARLYEELKDYLAMETDMTAGQLLRRLRECANNG